MPGTLKGLLFPLPRGRCAQGDGGRGVLQGFQKQERASVKDDCCSQRESTKVGLVKVGH